MTLITPPTGGSPGTFHPGDIIKWNITAESSNTTIPANPSVIRNLIIYDVLPTGLTYVPGSEYNSSPATFTQIGNTLIWTFGSAQLIGMPQAFVTFNVSVNSNIQNGTGLTNVANWTAQVFDHLLYIWSNQSATATSSILILKSPSTLTTALNVSSPITMGTPFHDNATLSGYVSNYSMNTNATITFYRSTNDINWVQIGSPVSAPASGGTVNSSDIIGLIGTYYFKAVYTGNAYYTNATSPDQSETLTISKAPTTITTNLTATYITLGGTAHDRANVTFPLSIPPFPVPTGTVTFTVQLLNGTWVPLGTVSTVWDNNTKQYYAVSANFTPTQAGNYYFNATYSGDGNYTGSFSTNLIYENLCVFPATPTVTTLLNATTITLGQSITDTATVTGLGGNFSVPTGTVTFSVQLPNGTWMAYDGTPSLNGSGKATSGAFTPTQTGIYHFNVTYSGDTSYNSSFSTMFENLTVTPGTPTVTTILSLVVMGPDPAVTSIILGQAVYDTATVTGLGGSYPVPTGTVTFSVQLPNGTLVAFDLNQPLISGSADSSNYYPLTAGTYYFKATYSGDGNYTVATSVLATEPLLVNATTSTTTTYLNATSITLGGTVHDMANVTFPLSIPPYPVPTGTITFSVRQLNGTWTSLGTVNGTWDPTGQVYYANSASFTPTQVGTYYFNATYNGNGNYTGSTGTFDSDFEILHVGPAASTVTTQFNATSIILGSGVYDNATVTSSFGVPTGFVLFQSNATGIWVNFANVTLNNGVAPFANYTPLYTGTFFFQAVYSGDSNHNGSTSALENVTVSQSVSHISTLVNNTSIALGGTVHDTANVTFLIPIPPFPVPTGTVTFGVEWPNGTWTSVGTVSTVWNNNTQQIYAVSADFTPTQAGTYLFNVTYSGDGNYTSSVEYCLCPHETLTVAPATPPVSTLLNATSITLGQNVTDTAIVTGLGGIYPAPTGTVWFWVWLPNGTAVHYDTETLNASGMTTSIPLTGTAAGTYAFNVWYLGDSTYNFVATVAANEVLTVAPVTPGVSTLLNSTSINLGKSVTDTAIVTGVDGITPTGTVWFWVWLPNGTAVHYDTETLNGSGMATSAAFTPTAAGTYAFNVWYLGDGNYNWVATVAANEVLTVAPATPPVSTLLNATSITLGQNVTDTAIVTGLGGIYPAPTGTVWFWVWLPNGTAVHYDTETLNGSGMVTSIAFTPTATGTYAFNIWYLGNGNYNWVATVAANEVLTVAPATPVVNTTLNATIVNGIPTITLGQAIYDNVTVTGSVGTPTGFVLFQSNRNGTWITFDNETLANGMASSVSFIPTGAGNWYFRAIYSGDSNYLGAQSNNTAELLCVNKANTIVVTNLNSTCGCNGNVVYDNATVYAIGSNLPTPTGVVQFQVNHNNSTWVTFDTEVLVNGMATSVPYTMTPTTGTWYFQAVYSGDGNYQPATSDPTSEEITFN